MRKFLVTLSLLLIIINTMSCQPLHGTTTISSIIERSPILSPNLSMYPDSSLVDQSDALDAPAGKHGFVSSKDGHFFFSDGTRARFFGVNLAKETVFIDKGQIDRLVALFARSGINLVRIHHIDDVSGIIDPTRPGAFRNDKLDLVDYWVAKLKERGIYLCLDLNDYRTFRISEGVENGEQLGRGAKPYAVFDQRLIELQQEYAKRFLADHINPYTGLSYANDPAIAILEIYDENGLFIRRDDWPNLREPYRTILQQQWNVWLRYRYGTSDALKAAWTDNTGNCALTAGENVEQATVKLPVMTLYTDPPKGTANPLQAPARVNDGAIFAYEMQMNYLQAMMGYLHGIGLKMPITAVGAQDIIPDLMATASATDYIGINYYWDHPSFNTGNEWQLPAYFSLLNPISDNLSYSFPVTVSMARMHNKPIVVRELGYCFPNPYRGVGTIEAAAYGAFLDVDALILFTYDAGVAKRTIGYFDIHLDPLRWGLVSEASRMFLSGEVKPATQAIGIGYSEVDAFSWRSFFSSLYQLSFVSKVENYTDPTTPNPYDLLVTSGRSCDRKWEGRNLLVFANQRNTDLHNKNTADGMDVRQGYQIQTGRGGSFSFTFRGVGYDAFTTRSIQAWPSYQLSDLRAKNLLPIATDDTSALGFIDPKAHIIGFRNLQEDLATRVAVDALHDWKNAAISHNDFDQGRRRSDTGQIDRSFAANLLRIETPTIQAIVGDFTSQAALQTSSLQLSTPTPIGTLVAESLDGKPLAETERYAIKMTSRAHNDQTLIKPSNDGPKPHKLTSLGEPPIITDGKPSATPTRLTFNGKVLLDMQLMNGTWEYVAEPERALLFLDTGDILVKLPQQPALIRWHTQGDVIEMKPTDNTFTVPAGVRFTEIIWGTK
ncbi:MAG TPA: hypothetical protein VHV83_09785 [Armatimonadota bacterium]|nr:hypothetical protein [Armatimonadota bacterium]